MKYRSGLFGAFLGVVIAGAAFYDNGAGPGQGDQLALDDVTTAYAANFVCTDTMSPDRLAVRRSHWARFDAPIASN